MIIAAWCVGIAHAMDMPAARPGRPRAAPEPPSGLDEGAPERVSRSKARGVGVTGDQE
jgi:hypothetical protein